MTFHRRATLSAVLLGALAVSACALPEPSYKKPNVAHDEMKLDYAGCQYQAELATANAGATLPPRHQKNSDMISDAVSSGVARGMEQADLIDTCMRMHGYKGG
ncbi:hypothetical protein [uncultured Albimonas sp.]|uniref:hypothetical protein n=1 Tax=uncultured Albimonas sp. TaxID=1331701 RepID=UPI0030EF9460|tara:strand:+ start:1695 stop:2003 length:309 start_codon:yes stop_codon:yes gene_type:complete